MGIFFLYVDQHNIKKRRKRVGEERTARGEKKEKERKEKTKKQLYR
jgi:hypothetical protein